MNFHVLSSVAAEADEKMPTCERIRSLLPPPTPFWDVYGKSFSFSGLSNFIRKNLKQPLALIYGRYISAGGNDYDRAERKWETSMANRTELSWAVRNGEKPITAPLCWQIMSSPWLSAVKCTRRRQILIASSPVSSSSTKSIFPMEPESNDIYSPHLFSSYNSCFFFFIIFFFFLLLQLANFTQLAVSLAFFSCNLRKRKKFLCSFWHSIKAEMAEKAKKKKTGSG